MTLREWLTIDTERRSAQGVLSPKFNETCDQHSEATEEHAEREGDELSSLFRDAGLGGHVEGCKRKKCNKI